MIKEIPIFIVTPEELLNIYKRNENFKESNLVIFHEKRIPICKIFYKNIHIRTYPYQLSGEKRNSPIAKKIFQFMIDDFIEKYQKGNRPNTIDLQIQYFFNFIDWIDKINSNLPETIGEAKNIFLNYGLFLKEQLRLNNISNFVGHVKHKAALRLLENIFSDKEGYIIDGNKIIQNKRIKSSTTVKKHDLEYSYKFYYQFFEIVSDFILTNKPYPLLLNVNNKNKIWVLPSRYRFITNEIQAPMAFNINNGNIKTLEEILNENNGIKIEYAKDNIRRFRNTINVANAYRSSQRLNLGLHALRAFYMLFLANTGMNDSTASTLPWNNDYNIEKSFQKFRNIKYRAGNKPVEFQIRKSFVSQFNKYIKLRSYLLGDKSFDFLFFTGKNNNIKIDKTMKDGGYSSWINRYFKQKINKSLPNITSRKTRVAKTKEVIKQYGIITASQMAQTSIDTLISHYQGTVQEEGESEISQYFEKLNNNIFIKNEADTTTIVGHCVSNSNKIVKDCKIGEGCLFCEHYRLHNDKEDFQKILSLKFIILECKHIAKDVEHFEDNYRKEIKRIDKIIEIAITSKQIEKKTISFYQEDVFENENLHPYWQHKLDTLVSMGVLK